MEDWEAGRSWGRLKKRVLGRWEAGGDWEAERRLEAGSWKHSSDWEATSRVPGLSDRRPWPSDRGGSFAKSEIRSLRCH